MTVQIMRAEGLPFIDHMQDHVSVTLHYSFFLSRVELLREDATPPAGCTMTTIGSSCEVYMQLKGLVDIPKEVARLEESIEKRSTQRTRLIQKTEAEGYEEKVQHI